MVFYPRYGLILSNIPRNWIAIPSSPFGLRKILQINSSECWTVLIHTSDKRPSHSLNTIQFCMNDLKKKKERWKNSRNIFKTLLCAPKSFSYSRCSIIVIQEKNTHAFEIELWVATDYGHPMKLFQNPKLGQTIWADQFRGIISAPILVQWVPCPHCKYLNARFECNDIVISIYSHYPLDPNAKSSDTKGKTFSIR